MSVNSSLAFAARRVRALNDRLPAEHQLDIADEWDGLLDRIEGRTDAQARRIIGDWTEELEQRLCCTLVNSPLDWEAA